MIRSPLSQDAHDSSSDPRETFAWTIPEQKFTLLSSQRQHEFLAWLARSALRTHRYQQFLTRYQELLGWTNLDSYKAPAWLKPAEALEEFIAFHSLFIRLPIQLDEREESPRSLSWQPRFPISIVMDQIRSPYNVGSILRLIDNFGFKELIHASNWVRLDHPQLRKAARGCERWIPVIHIENLPLFLDQSNRPVVALENDALAINVRTWKTPPDCLLVLGNETYGIAAEIRQRCHQSVAVDVHGYKHSMNVNQAFAVVGAHIVDQLISLV